MGKFLLNACTYKVQRKRESNTCVNTRITALHPKHSARAHSTHCITHGSFAHTHTHTHTHTPLRISSLRTSFVSADPRVMKPTNGRLSFAATVARRSHSALNSSPAGMPGEYARCSVVYGSVVESAFVRFNSHRMYSSFRSECFPLFPTQPIVNCESKGECTYEKEQAKDE